MYKFTSDPVVVDVALEHLEVLRVPHEVGVDLKHQTRDQSRTPRENVRHVQAERQVVADVDGDRLGRELGVELVAQVEVVDRMGEGVDGSREERKVGGVLKMRVQYPANQRPVHNLQADLDKKQALR